MIMEELTHPKEESLIGEKNKPKRQRNVIKVFLNSSDESDKDCSVSDNSDCELSEDEWNIPSKKRCKVRRRAPKQTLKMKLAEKTKHLRKLSKLNADASVSKPNAVLETNDVKQRDPLEITNLKNNVTSERKDIPNITSLTLDIKPDKMGSSIKKDDLKIKSESLPVLAPKLENVPKEKKEISNLRVKPKSELCDLKSEVKIQNKFKITCDIDLTESESEVKKENSSDNKSSTKNSQEPIVLMYSMDKPPKPTVHPMSSISSNFTTQTPINQNITNSLNVPVQMNPFLVSSQCAPNIQVNQNQQITMPVYQQNPVYNPNMQQNYIQSPNLARNGNVSNIRFPNEVSQPRNYSPRHFSNGHRTPVHNQISPRQKTSTNFTPPSRHRSPALQRTSTSTRSPKTGSPAMRPRRIFSPAARSPRMNTPVKNSVQSVNNSGRKNSVLNKLNNISPNGTVIHTGTGSVTITPRKITPERPPVQRKLFKNEIEGKISCRSENGTLQYVVNLANGTHIALSNIQVQKLREQNNGVLPVKLRIPVPSDVADKIEPSFIIDD